MLKRRAFDLIILDLHQPNANGEAAIAWLSQCGRELPPIILYAARRIAIEAWPSELRALVKASANAEQLRVAVVDELRSREDDLGTRFKKTAGRDNAAA